MGRPELIPTQAKGASVLLTSFLGSPKSPDGVISNDGIGWCGFKPHHRDLVYKGVFSNYTPFRDCKTCNEGMLRPVTAPFRASDFSDM